MFCVVLFDQALHPIAHLSNLPIFAMHLFSNLLCSSTPSQHAQSLSNKHPFFMGNIKRDFFPTAARKR